MYTLLFLTEGRFCTKWSVQIYSACAFCPICKSFPLQKPSNRFVGFCLFIVGVLLTQSNGLTFVQRHVFNLFSCKKRNVQGPRLKPDINWCVCPVTETDRRAMTVLALSLKHSSMTDVPSGWRVNQCTLKRTAGLNTAELTYCRWHINIWPLHLFNKRLFVQLIHRLSRLPPLSAPLWSIRAQVKIHSTGFHHTTLSLWRDNVNYCTCKSLTYCGTLLHIFFTDCDTWWSIRETRSPFYSMCS